MPRQIERQSDAVSSNGLLVVPSSERRYRSCLHAILSGAESRCAEVETTAIVPYPLSIIHYRIMKHSLEKLMNNEQWIRDNVRRHRVVWETEYGAEASRHLDFQ
jgi:hypothetical protein